MTKKRFGKCYQLSYKYVVDHFDYVLIHGSIQNIFSKYREIIAHAWCEKDDVIYDVVLDKTFPKIVYYGVYNANPIYKYTALEAVRNALEYKHYGEWQPTNIEIDLRVFDEKGKRRKEID